MLQVSHNMFLCVEVVRNNETFSKMETQHKLRRGSLFVNDYAFLWQTDAPTGSNSVFEPLLSNPSFHFLSELQLKISL